MILTKFLTINQLFSKFFEFLWKMLHVVENFSKNKSKNFEKELILCEKFWK
jgi:hypothetical protein